MIYAHVAQERNINNAVANKLANPDKSKGKREFFFLSKNRPK